jgi:hypothetical protein
MQIFFSSGVASVTVSSAVFPLSGVSMKRFQYRVVKYEEPAETPNFTRIFAG